MATACGGIVRYWRINTPCTTIQPFHMNSLPPVNGSVMLNAVSILCYFLAKFIPTLCQSLCDFRRKFCTLWKSFEERCRYRTPRRSKILPHQISERVICASNRCHQCIEFKVWLDLVPEAHMTTIGGGRRLYNELHSKARILKHSVYRVECSDTQPI